MCGVGVPSESLLLIVNTVIYRHRARDVIIFSRVLILIILHSNLNNFYTRPPFTEEKKK